MVEISVYLLAVFIMFSGLGISSIIVDIIEFIKKGKWYIAVISVVVLTASYFICVEVFKCIVN